MDKEEQLPFKTIVDNFILLPHSLETVFELWTGTMHFKPNNV